jgi:hypothetical protein
MIIHDRPATGCALMPLSATRITSDQIQLPPYGAADAVPGLARFEVIDGVVWP